MAGRDCPLGGQGTRVCAGETGEKAEEEEALGLALHPPPHPRARPLTSPSRPLPCARASRTLPKGGRTTGTRDHRPPPPPPTSPRGRVPPFAISRMPSHLDAPPGR